MSLSALKVRAREGSALETRRVRNARANAELTAKRFSHVPRNSPQAANKTQREGRTTRAVSFARTHAQDAETAARAKDAGDARTTEQTRTKDGAGVEGAAPARAEEAQNIQRGGGAERAPSERARTTRAETLISASETRKKDNRPFADAAVVRDDDVAAEEYARFVAANTANAPRFNPPGGPSAMHAMPRASWPAERDAPGPPPANVIAGAASSGPSRGSLASNLSELTNDAARGGAAGAPALPPGLGVARANGSYGFRSGRDAGTAPYAERDAPGMDGTRRNVVVNPPPPFAVTANGFPFPFGDAPAAPDPVGFYVEHGSPPTGEGSGDGSGAAPAAARGAAPAAAPGRAAGPAWRTRRPRRRAPCSRRRARLRRRR